MLPAGSHQPPSATPTLPEGFDWRRALWHGGFLLGFTGLMAWAWHGARIDPLLFLQHSENSTKLAREFFPPDFTDWRTYLDEMAVTLHMALWGTFLAVIAAIPLGILGASNITPWWIHQPIRRMMDMLRAVNEMVFALFFMVSVGLGPFAGTLALAVHTAGVLGKLFSEVVESIDHRPVEGIRSTGANRLEEVIYGVIPQVLPMWVSYALYRFESNVRSAAVVGMIGAGGIGFFLNETMKTYNYPAVAAIMAMIIATVMLIDVISARIRKAAL